MAAEMERLFPDLRSDPFSAAPLAPLSRRARRRGEVPVPDWAREMMARVCRRENHVAPALVWQRSVHGVLRKQPSLGLDGRSVWARERVRYESSSGVTYGWHECRVREGTDRVDAEYVLLHELAHDVAGCNAGHGPRFHRTLARLCMAEDAERGTTFTEYGKTRDGLHFAAAVSLLRWQASHPQLWEATP